MLLGIVLIIWKSSTIISVPVNVFRIWSLGVKAKDEVHCIWMSITVRLYVVKDTSKASKLEELV